ncbi:hypothetical protein N7522_005950 [Penicillium canescens]|nr:hypothetical protein N7522_005950 [Penicillium canescens]
MPELEARPDRNAEEAMPRNAREALLGAQEMPRNKTPPGDAVRGCTIHLETTDFNQYRTYQAPFRKTSHYLRHLHERKNLLQLVRGWIRRRSSKRPIKPRRSTKRPSKRLRNQKRLRHRKTKRKHNCKRSSHRETSIAMSTKEILSLDQEEG